MNTTTAWEERQPTRQRPERARRILGYLPPPTGGEAQAFTAYFQAEIKIEMELDPPRVIDGEPGTLDIEVEDAFTKIEMEGFDD